jgi:hypothetical protein
MFVTISFYVKTNNFSTAPSEIVVSSAIRTEPSVSPLGRPAFGQFAHRTSGGQIAFLLAATIPQK